MFKYKDDLTQPVITAGNHIAGCHRRSNLKLSKTALLFYMHGGIEFLTKNYNTGCLTERFPRFLNACPVYQVKGYNNLCFLNGGYGAPQSADTVETLNALGVKKIVSVGMLGAFSKNLKQNDIIIPSKAFSEEGTSRHYYENAEFFCPDETLMNYALESIINGKNYPIVTTDAVYRQTFYKENLWRNKGAVGVDMETSALFSVGKYLGIKVVSVLIVSDVHPYSKEESKWEWTMLPENREIFFEKTINFALNL